MAVVLVDGFDVYNGDGTLTGLQSKWFLNSTQSTDLISGRFSGQALRISNSTPALARRSFPNTTSMGLGVALRAAGFPTGDLLGFNILAILSTGTYTLGLICQTTGAISVYRATGAGAGTFLGASNPGVIVANTWHYLEVGLEVHATLGSVSISVDGRNVLTLTNVNTSNGVANVNQLQLGPPNNLLGNGTFDYDDLYITDSNSTIGERRIETLYPTSDIVNGWTPSTGTSNFALVDEAQVNGDTDYIQATAIGTVDTYGFQDLSGTPGIIDAVQVSAFAEKTDATTRAIQLQVISGGTTSNGASFNLATNYNKFERLMLLNPNGNISWTYLTVNALTGGPTISA